MRKYILSIIAFALCFAINAETVTIGYTNGYFKRNEGVRFGTKEEQGLAIKISKEKSSILKGGEITGISSVFGTSQISDMVIFITKDLNGAPISKAIAKGGSTRFKTFKFDNPVKIDGEEFYVGYTFKVGTTYKALQFDKSKDFSGELFYSLIDGKWNNITNKGYGAPNIQLEVQGVNNFTDVIIKPIDANGYYKEGNSYKYNGQIMNFGTNTITSFEIEQKVGNADAIVYKVEDLSLKSGETYDFTLPEYNAKETGRLGLNVSIIKINGESSDLDITDNKCETSTFIYPKDVQKKILIECFTGQTCGNCPTGHRNLTEALKGKEDDFVEVAHHAGYYPDTFTMKEDLEYTFFYGGNTFAPGCMINRTPYEDGLTSPVFELTNKEALDAALVAFKDVQPYVSIDLGAKYYKGNKVVGVEVKVTTHVVPSDKEHRLNIFITQNNIESAQAGNGGTYPHNHTFRGAITDVWGFPISLEEGKSESYYFGMELPDSIKSTHENKNKYKVVLEDMQIVAFVCDLSNSHMGCPVYNANISNLQVVEGEGDVAIDDVDSIEKCNVYSDNGYINISGEYKSAVIYNTTGMLIDRFDNGNSSNQISKGIYIIKIEKSNGTHDIQKIYVK